MKVTPIEIRQKDFQKVFRGYEKEEVDAFLQSLSQEWEKLQDESRELKKKCDVAEKEVARLREVESSLFRALKAAEDSGKYIVEQANKTAETHVREAQLDAEAVLNEARSKARSLVEEAEERVRETTAQLSDAVRSLHKDYQYIQNEKEQLVKELTLLMQETLEKISKTGTGELPDFSVKDQPLSIAVTEAPKEKVVVPKPEKSSGSQSFFDTI